MITPVWTVGSMILISAVVALLWNRGFARWKTRKIILIWVKIIEELFDMGRDHASLHVRLQIA